MANHSNLSFFGLTQSEPSEKICFKHVLAHSTNMSKAGIRTRECACLHNAPGRSVIIMADVKTSKSQHFLAWNYSRRRIMHKKCNMSIKILCSYVL